eukprot:612295-Ditylum_brightwellii.AAC.1
MQEAWANSTDLRHEASLQIGDVPLYKNSTPVRCFEYCFEPSFDIVPFEVQVHIMEIEHIGDNTAEQFIHCATIYAAGYGPGPEKFCQYTFIQ